MIRLAVPEDFTSIMSIYAYARSFMQETGNPNQWGNHFPPEELIHNRIRNKQLFVLEENGTLHGAFAFIITGAHPDRIYIAPIFFLLGVHFRVAVHFRGGSLKNFRVKAFCKAQHVDGAVHRGFKGLHRVALVVNGRGRAG